MFSRSKQTGLFPFIMGTPYSFAFLEGEDLLTEFCSLVRRDFQGNPNLFAYGIKDSSVPESQAFFRAQLRDDGKNTGDEARLPEGVIVGSNPFGLAVWNNFLDRHGISVATPDNLSRFAHGSLRLTNLACDTGLILRSAGDSYDSNDYVARTLAEDVRKRDPVLGQFRAPVVIPIESLGVVNDQGSVYGLAFRLISEPHLFAAPALARNGTFSSYSRHENGLPQKISGSDGGDAVVTTRHDGLSRLTIWGGRSIGADSPYLAFSDSQYRTAAVKIS